MSGSSPWSPGKAIDVGMLPWIVLDLLLQIRPLPVLDALGFFAQRLQALIGGGIYAGIQLVRPQRGRKGIDLCVRRGDLRAVRLMHHFRQYQRRE